MYTQCTTLISYDEIIKQQTSVKILRAKIFTYFVFWSEATGRKCKTANETMKINHRMIRRRGLESLQICTLLQMERSEETFEIQFSVMQSYTIQRNLILRHREAYLFMKFFSINGISRFIPLTFFDADAFFFIPLP